MEEEPRGAPVLPPELSLVGGRPGGGVGLGLGVPCGGGPVGLGGALGVELPVAGGTGVLGGGRPVGLGRDPGLNLAVAGVLKGMKFIARLGLWQVRTAPISYPLPPASPI